MDGEELREIEAAMAKVRRACRLLQRICAVCLVAFSIAWIVLICLQIVFAIDQQWEASRYGEVLFAFMHGFVIVILLFAATLSFSDVAKGHSPFTAKQVYLFRLASILLVLLAVVDAILSTSFYFGFEVAGFDIAAYQGHQMGSAKVNIDMMTLFFAAILYGVSVLFRYGVLLQRLTDETE